MSKRFEDTPDLFGSGSGSGTYVEIRCEICGTVYNAGCGVGENGEQIDENLSCDSETFTDFAGIVVCSCCFWKVEREIINRIHNILPWFSRILKSQRMTLESKEAMLDIVKEAINNGQ